jgi:hypothetical protein
MEWKDVGNAVTHIAPTLGNVLGNAFGGPAVGTLAQTAVSALLSALGMKSDAKPDDVMAAIAAADPETKLKIINAENDFKLKQRDLDIQELKAQLADIQSARQREIETTKATGKRDINLYILAWVIMGGFISLIACLIIMQFVFGKTLQSDPIITLCLGSFSTDAGMVVGYFFGTSKSSADKTEMMSKMIASK